MRTVTRVGLALGAALVLVACSDSTGSSKSADPNGNWTVTAHVTSCYDATGSATITVANDSFPSQQVFSYSTYGQNQTVSVEGSMTPGNGFFTVSGNEYLAGTACNGGNGFYGYIQADSMAGTVYSSWGSLRFEKK